MKKIVNALLQVFRLPEDDDSDHPPPEELEVMRELERELEEDELSDKELK